MGVFLSAKRRCFLASCLLPTFIGIAADGRADQPQGPVNIPLYYYYDPSNPLLSTEAKLAIDVSIEGGEAKPYIFDTGSPVFNAAFGSWWGGVFEPGTSVPDSNVYAPDGTQMNNAEFCYGDSVSSLGFCRGWTGNMVHVTELGFHYKDDAAATVKLTANPGYVMTAGSTYVDQAGTAYNFPFDSGPPMYGHFWGVFGAGNFAPDVNLVNDGTRTASGYHAGGILGQTIVDGVMAQGYVVAANGQKNPLSDINGPQQVDGITVEIGGETKPITPCSPCVTVGLTPEMLGQFWAATPKDGGDDGKAGVIPWKETGQPFQNPYGGDTQNNASVERGTDYTTRMTSPDGTIHTTAPGLLDTGTGTLNLGVNDSPSLGEISSAYQDDPACLHNGGCSVDAGVNLEISGSHNGNPIVGLPPTEMTVTQDTNATYNTQLQPVEVQNTIGISFFTQNAVLYDLTNKVIGYTPFFVTDAALVTTADGPLIVDGDNVWLGLAGVVSGAGGIRIEDGGKVQLSAANTYTGRTEILSGADLYISGLGSIAPSAGVSNDGIFDISRAWNPVSIQDLTGSGKTRLGGQELIITDAAGTFSGIISDNGVFPGTGGGLTLVDGILTLTGDSTYTGLTKVEKGTLIVNGAITSDVSVKLDGTLSGIGTVGSIDVAGIISPGASTAPGHGIGTLHVEGHAVLADATYQVEANAAGAADRLVVRDAVTLDNAFLEVLAAGGDYASSTSYLIIDKTGAGAIAGSFSEITSNSIFVSPSVVYDGGNGNDAVLTLDAVAYETFADTRNQRAVANALDAAAFGPIAASIFYLDEANAREAFTQLAGEVHPTTLGILAEDSRYLRQAVLGRTVQAQYQDLGSDVAISAAGGVPTPEEVPAASSVGFWAQAFGAWADYDGDGNAAGGKRDLGGFVTGLDVGLDGTWRLGAAAGYSQSSINLDGHAGSADVDSYALAVYGGGGLGPIALRAGAAWSWHDIDISRSVSYPGVFEHETASYDGDTGQIFGELAYPIISGDMAIEPFAGLAYVHVKTDEFEEDGGMVALVGKSADQDVGFSTLGLRWAGHMMMGETALMPRAALAWQHGFDELTPETAFIFTDTEIGFTATGLPIVRDSALIDIGFAFELAPGVTLGASYAGQFADDLQDNSVQGRLGWTF